jgi:3D (Asp-Asp-Asp) domain-containing protein
MELEIDKRTGFVRRKKDIGLSITMVLFAIAFMGLLIGIGYEMGRYLARPKIMQSMKPEVAKIVKCDSIPITVTIYHPTIKQCDASPLITADGSKINSKQPQRWCGVSRDLFKIFKYNDTINVNMPLNPIMSGDYIIHDCGAKRLIRHVDILIANPTVCNIQGKWKGFIIIKTKKPDSKK